VWLETLFDRGNIGKNTLNGGTVMGLQEKVAQARAWHEEEERIAKQRASMGTVREAISKRKAQAEQEAKSAGRLTRTAMNEVKQETAVRKTGAGRA